MFTRSRFKGTVMYSAFRFSACLFWITYSLKYILANGAETNEILQFWKPNPQFDIRRANQPKINNVKLVKNLKNAITGQISTTIKTTKNWPKVNLVIRPRASTRMLYNYSKLHEAPPAYGLKDWTKEDFDSHEAYSQLNPYDIRNQLKKIARKFSNASIAEEVMGRTAEYKDIVLLRITKKEDEEARKRNLRKTDKYVTDTKKKIIFIVHGLVVMGLQLIPCLHRGEQFIRLLSFYLEYLDDFDIFIIPIANPDGFTKHTLSWNKNVSPQQDCAGVALDRNFDVAWDSNHTISSCSQLYPGPRPFSEEESKAIRDIFYRYGNRIIAYFNVHSGTYNGNVHKGDAVLYPKGYTDIQSEEDKYIDLKGEIDEAIANASFKIITVNVDTLYSWYGKVRGTSVDFASKIYGIPFAMELVMQPYSDIEGNTFSFSNAALNNVWHPVIDTIFKFIRNTIKPKDEEEEE